ncbi:hypothetical protein GCM10027418_16990 [Mariniluteicoccus endophyticus]
MAALAAGGLLSLALPRGPQTGPVALMTALAALAVGGLLGHLHPARRWLLVVAAWVGYEVLRWRIGTPSTLPISPRLLTGSQYALGATLFGRGVDLLLVFLPFWVGTRLTRVREGVRSLSRAYAVVAVVLALLAGGLLVPARTPAPTGQVGEIRTVRIAGCDHRVVIRGRAGAPVVLFLSGGPGGTEIGTIRNQWTAVERTFTVALWDQTGAGLNGRCFPRDGRLTMDRLVDDGAQVDGRARHA